MSGFGSRSLSILSILAVSAALAPQAAAMPFAPVLDEFWVMKGDGGGPLVETFRDSFSDGAVPNSGPQDGLGGNPNTYTSNGTAGFTDESGGKLTMTPSLGTPSLISGFLADTFTGAIKLRSLAPGNADSLELADHVEIHGLFDLSSLPDKAGQNFGIRFTDRGGGNAGDDVMQLAVGWSSDTGEVVVRLTEADFFSDTLELADIVPIGAHLGTATQIELVLSKAAGTGEINAYFTLFNSIGGTVFTSGLMDNVNDVTGNPLAIYDGVDGPGGSGDEAYTRAQFFSTDSGVPIPAPATALLLGAGLAALAWARRRAA